MLSDKQMSSAVAIGHVVCGNDVFLILLICSVFVLIFSLLLDIDKASCVGNKCSGQLHNCLMISFINSWFCFKVKKLGYVFSLVKKLKTTILVYPIW